MSSEAQDILSTFNALPAPAQHDAAVAILRQTADWDLGPIDDEGLAQIADELFMELDRREAADGA
jgi:hypothetical protein